MKAGVPGPSQNAASVNDLFTEPTRRRKNKWQKLNASVSTPTETSNQYAVLSDIDSDTDDERVESTKKRVNKKTPPIVIPGKAISHASLVELISQHCKTGFFILYKSEHTEIHVTDASERRALLAHLDGTKARYYTFSCSDEKNRAFVLRGLDGSPSDAAIKVELETVHELQNVTIYKMRETRRPSYLITTKTNITLREIQGKIKYLCHTKIKWERHINKKLIVQCHRCQQWGHGTSNCRMTPACVKCGESHWTKDCTKCKDTAAKCANCAGSHTANNIHCPVYIKKLEMRTQGKRNSQRQSAAVRPQWTPAPMPTSNVWEQRAAARAQQQHAHPQHQHQHPQHPQSRHQQPAQIPPPQIPLPQPPPSKRQSPQPRSAQFPPLQASGLPAAGPSRRNPTNEQVSTPRDTIGSAGESDSGGAVPRQNGGPPADVSDPNNFLELLNEVEKLNKLINLDNMLKAIKDLNIVLSSCKSASETFTTFLSFTKNIASYGI